MGISVNENRIKWVSQIADILNHAAVYEFSALSGPSVLPQAAGVYVIFNKWTNEVYYVGKTTNLQRRLYHNHLMGPLTNARLKKYLIDDSAFPGILERTDAKNFIKENCSFIFILEPDMRARGHLEGLVSFLTDCRYVDKEH